MSDVEESDLPAGTVLDKYSIVRPIGAGGMGAIYEATHTDLGKRVAIKTLHPELARNAEARARFLREGQAATRLRHAHVVDVVDVGVSHGVPYLVMEFLDGETLAALIEREGQLGIERIAEIMLPVLSAVATAHDEQIVHRDLKPENIFLARTRHGAMHPKLLDFGISKVADTASSGLALTGTNALLGTPFYMSPEQASGAKRVDARSDQYALGVILYECATGLRPFRAETLFTLLSSIVAGDFAPPRTLRADLPAAFEAAVLRAMSRDAGERFESVTALAREILPLASTTVRAVWSGVFASTGASSPSPVEQSVAVSVASGTPSRSRSTATPATPSMLGGTTLSASATERAAVETPPPTRRVAALAVVLAATVIAAAVAWTMRRGVTPTPRISLPATTAPPPMTLIAITPPTSAPAQTAQPATPTVQPQATPRSPVAATSVAAPDAATPHAHRASGQRDGTHMGVNNSPVFE